MLYDHRPGNGLMDERLQKILSQWGVASRRQAEQLILEGRVQVNGSIAQLGQKANPILDEIEVDGQPLQSVNRPLPIYLLMHKPSGVVTTCNDPWHRQTVFDLLPQALRQSYGIHPVGRLDADSTGALLLTNDGNITFCLTHPRHAIPKTYCVWIQGHPPDAVLQQWRQGIILSGRVTLPAQIQLIETTRDQTCLKIVLREGRNRQIRRVAEQLGHPVVSLHRVAIGSIQLQQLSLGQLRSLTETEVRFLQMQAEQLKRSLEPSLFSPSSQF
jgi:23S rRNA pseudouridine2605 synthase